MVLRKASSTNITPDLMTEVEPLSDNQSASLKSWEEGKHMFIYGCAGTGKTFCALYNALKDTICDNPKYESRLCGSFFGCDP